MKNTFAWLSHRYKAGSVNGAGFFDIGQINPFQVVALSGRTVYLSNGLVLELDEQDFRLLTSTAMFRFSKED